MTTEEKALLALCGFVVLAFAVASAWMWNLEF
jgi:hypothetical protein